MRIAKLWLVLGLLVAPAVGGHAQRARAGRGVAGSGLEQGEVLVAVRSDVRLAIKGIRATLNDRLAAMTSAISSEMPAVRECYSKLVATRPATVGGLRAVVVLEPGASPPNVEITEVDGSDAALTSCVAKLLRGLNLRGVERPAAVEVTLTFDNTRARGQAAVDATQAAFTANLERQQDGSYVGRWQTENNEISFVVRVGASDGEPLAQTLVGAVRAGFYGFVDCRRRSGRHGMNPAGEIEMDLRIAGDGKISGHVTRITVEDTKRTPACVEKAATRLQLTGHRGAARASVTVVFAG